MEIRFCDRCHESIPDADFDAGRAVAVEGRTYHVSCAMVRALSLSGMRSWLTLLLALYAAGVATFLLLAAAGQKTDPDRVAPAVQARIDEAAGGAETRAGEQAGRLVDALRGDVGQVGEAIRSLQEQAAREVQDLSGRLDAMDAKSASLIEDLQKRIAQHEAVVGQLVVLVREAQEQARRDAVQPDPGPPPPVEPVVPPPPPEPPPEEPTPPVEPPPPPPRDPEHDAKVDLWISRLGDSNENVRFTATLELGRLKDLRATAPLIEVLNRDRDYYVRLGAATALGDLKAADAVIHLIEALNDKDALVRTAAHDALQSITGHQEEFQGEMSSRDRRAVMRAWKSWWEDHEEEVRERLGQPASAG